ncbi:MAG TPA: xanthine dehydrogenase family protein molybdopterin-binding subunit, partial [Kofleriaceae bacterium]|nr:xanthine dehydrogenase family protein molybdopterin-binding subunit [Kofleriaceae bacterium]
LQLLQDAEVHYAEQPIAVVVADTLEDARCAAGLISASYRGERPPVSDLADALSAAFTPATTATDDEPDSARGDVERGLAEAAVTVDATYTTPVEHHHPMELHATIAAWDGPDRLTVHDATQGLFNVRQRLATVFGLPADHVRVVNHHVGGGFGCKTSPWSHVALAAIAARAVGRPVKLVVTRSQMFSLTGHRAATIQRVVLGADATGALTAIRHESTSGTSRFDEFAEPAAVATRMLYACPNVVTTHRVGCLDAPTPTYQRAPGHSTGAFALESAIDELAYALHIDPLELRIKNHAARDEHIARPFSSKSLLACYEQASSRFGWSARSREPVAQRIGRDLVGWGMATATYPTHLVPSSAIARLRANGTALVQAGTQDLGTGTYTIMTQIAADALALPFERVTFELGDTALPPTPVSGGSFTAASTGSAVKLACRAAIAKLADMASRDPRSPLHGAPRAQIEADDGALVLRGAPGHRDPFAEVLRRAGLPELAAVASSRPGPAHDEKSMHAFGAVFVEVRVDDELGLVRIPRVVAAYAAGKILNPKTARSQLLGGLVWGIGMATHEVTVRDRRTARVVTRELEDYHLPVHADMPAFDVILVDEVDDHVNEIGAKGIGEIGIVGVAAAIANAVFHATGVRIRDLPIRVDKLMRP